MISLGISLAAGIAALYTLVSIRFVLQSFAWVGRNQRWERSTHGLCPACGYDLRANVSGICPECGTRIERRAPNKAPAGLSLLSESQPWWVWTVVVAVMIFVVVLQSFLR